MTTDNYSHKSVLLNECIETLEIIPDGIYVDCTAGGGGHSAKILEKLGQNGRLIAIDRDPDAIETLTKRFKEDKRVIIVNELFKNIKNILHTNNITTVDGILADLGVSSFQLDTKDRGFSFHTDAPLDMRMSKSGISAKDVVNSYELSDLTHIINMYGDEKYARNIAKNIIERRKIKEIETTFDLCEIISDSVPAAVKRKGHPARKTFQAIRIEVNGEIDSLSQSVKDMFEVLNENGVLAIISFHSLEDRVVKQTYAEFTKGCTCPPEFPVCVCGKTPKGKTKKPVLPKEEEINENKRARSAKLRAIKKL